jgi:hypothetical protein
MQVTSPANAGSRYLHLELVKLRKTGMNLASPQKMSAKAAAAINAADNPR